MEIYKVGRDELSQFDFENLPKDMLWFVYNYEVYGYEGGGQGVGFKDGLLWIYNLGHCSCYEPLETNWSKRSQFITLTINQFLSPDILNGEYESGIYSKCKELLERDKVNV